MLIAFLLWFLGYWHYFSHKLGWMRSFDPEKTCKEMFCLLWNVTNVVFLSFLSQNGRQKVSAPISLTPAPSKACVPASAQAPLISCVAICRLCPFDRGRWAILGIKNGHCLSIFLERKIYDRHISSMNADSMSLWGAPIKSDVTPCKQW